MDEQELEKQFQEMEDDTQVQAAKAATTQATPKKKRITMADLKKDLSDLESYIENEVLAWCDQLDDRLKKLEQFQTNPPQTEATDHAARLGALEQAVIELSDALPTIGAAIAELRQPPKPEIEFAQPPAHPEPVTPTKGDIEAVAAVCQSLPDVLMICRALKAAKDLTDDDRLYILQVACRMAGELITNGLKIRAGIKYVAE